MSEPGTPRTTDPGNGSGGGVMALLGRLSLMRRVLVSSLWKAEARLRGVEMTGDVLFLGRPVLSRAAGSRIIFEGNNEVFSSLRCNPLGNVSPCVVRTLLPGAVLRIGRGVGMSSAVICAASGVE